MKCFLPALFFLFCGGVFAQSGEYNYTVQAVPFTEFTYTRQTEIPKPCITILGWSRDGKLLYRLESDYRFSELGAAYDCIIDLVEDKMMWIEYRRYMPADFHKTERKDYLSIIAEQFGIEPVIDGNGTGMFPYITARGQYDILTKEEIHNAYDGRLKVFIYNKANIDKTKYINEINIDPAEWDDEDYNYYGELKFWFVKSPFENRLAVIFIIPVSEYDPVEFTYFHLEIYGTHLNVEL
ncbi:MAG: hypothetical protein LBL43_06200 [Treponema sp.]|jgi:hypothetical protein|nr:hypothetical protein [Treponema sp.]